ncbi:DUF418 domain-containing protein [Kytococcus sp. Marseille-QA3725]
MSSDPTEPRLRLPALDVARGVAVISMLVAHFAPGTPLGFVTGLSEWLTAALFALLIGAGAAASRNRPLGRSLAIAAVRGLVLVVAGLLLERSPGQIDVVLVELGALTAVSPLFARLPSVVLGLVALVLTGVAHPLIGVARGVSNDLWVGGSPHLARVVEILASGVHYRLTTLLIHAAIGVLVMRHLTRARRGPLALVAAVFAAAALAGLAAHRLGLASSVPYTGTPTEIAVSAGLSLLVVSLCLLLVRDRTPLVLEPLRAAGTMAMSLYVLQVAGVSAWLGTQAPGTSDDSWVIVAVTVIASLVIPRLWQAVTPWRGPLEAVTDALVRPLRGRPRTAAPKA